MTDIKTLEQKKQEALDKANRLQKQIEKKLTVKNLCLGVCLWLLLNMSLTEYRKF